jgi:hypothetical protein
MRTKVLGLYRAILRSARDFPSIKRDRIIADIKTEFRENKSLQDAKAVKSKLDVAADGLAKLRMYAPMKSGTKSAWSLDLADGQGVSGKL